MPHSIIRIVDLETTGFAPPEHAPVEIAWCDLVSGRNDPAGAPPQVCVMVPVCSHFMVDPGRPIPPDSSAIHHIIDEDVRGAIPWPVAIEQLTATLTPIRAFAAHNERFERQWITDEIAGGPPWICTWKCALRAWPEAPGHSNQTLRYWRRPIGLDRDLAMPAHRAAPDAYVTAFLLRDLLDVASLETLIQWSGEPALLPRVPFGRETRGMRWTEVDDGFLDWVLDRNFDEDVMFTARHEIERRAAAADAARERRSPEGQSP